MHEAQAEAGVMAGSSPAGVASHEPIEEVRHLVARHPAPRVGDLEPHRAQANAALPPGVGVVHQITEQVLDHRAQEHRVGLDRTRLDLHRHLEVTRPGPRGECGPHVRDQVVHPDGLGVDLDLPGLDPAQREETLHHRLHSLHDDQELVEHGRGRARGRALDLERRPEPGQRRAELVRDVRAQRPLAFHRGRNPGQEVVQPVHHRDDLPGHHVEPDPVGERGPLPTLDRGGQGVEGTEPPPDEQPQHDPEPHRGHPPHQEKLDPEAGEDPVDAGVIPGQDERQWYPALGCPARHQAGVDLVLIGRVAPVGRAVGVVEVIGVAPGRSQEGQRLLLLTLVRVELILPGDEAEGHRPHRAPGHRHGERTVRRGLLGQLQPEVIPVAELDQAGSVGLGEEEVGGREVGLELRAVELRDAELEPLRTPLHGRGQHRDLVRQPAVELGLERGPRSPVEEEARHGENQCRRHRGPGQELAPDRGHDPPPSST